MKMNELKMNQRFIELAERAGFVAYGDEGNEVLTSNFKIVTSEAKWFAWVIFQECIDNLEIHGHTEAVQQLKWLKADRLGVK